MRAMDADSETVGYDPKTGRVDLAEVEAKIGNRTACVIIQSPNFFGVVEQIPEAAELAHKHGALLIVVFTEAVSLALLEPPREADIVVGELQSFAISPSYGGPFAGIMATKEKFIRQIPGRLVGETKDANGNRAFCLTLSTREQHIRREESHFEHLHQPGSDRPDGNGLPIGLRQGRSARAGGTEPGQDALPGRWAEAEI